jgi:carbohydrate-selective porin OprB
VEVATTKRSQLCNQSMHGGGATIPQTRPFYGSTSKQVDKQQDNSRTAPLAIGAGEIERKGSGQKYQVIGESAVSCGRTKDSDNKKQLLSKFVRGGFKTDQSNLFNHAVYVGVVELTNIVDNHGGNEII